MCLTEQHKSISEDIPWMEHWNWMAWAKLPTSHWVTLVYSLPLKMYSQSEVSCFVFSGAQQELWNIANIICAKFGASGTSLSSMRTNGKAFMHRGSIPYSQKLGTSNKKGCCFHAFLVLVFPEDLVGHSVEQDAGPGLDGPFVWLIRALLMSLLAIRRTELLDTEAVYLKHQILGTYDSQDLLPSCPAWVASWEYPVGHYNTQDACLDSLLFCLS